MYRNHYCRDVDQYNTTGDDHDHYHADEAAPKRHIQSPTVHPVHPAILSVPEHALATAQAIQDDRVATYTPAPTTYQADSVDW